MSIFTRTISAITPAIVGNAMDVANDAFSQWAKESKVISETFSEDRVKVKVVAEKARLMADIVAAEQLLKKSAQKALPRNEVMELHSLYDQMFSDNPQTTQTTTVELL